MASDRCEYRHDVADYADVDGEAWRCPHPAREDDRCVFHLPLEAKDADEVVDALLATVAGDGDAADRPNEFLGAHFGRLPLQGVRLTTADADPVDLRDASVEGALDWSRLHSELPLRLDGLVVEGTAVLDDAHFAKEVVLTGATFGAPASFFDVAFEEDARFNDVRFAALATFYDAAFAADARFTDCEFRSYAKFTGCEVAGKAQFGRGRFAARTYFTDVTFAGDALFDDATFDDVTSFRASRFRGAASFDGAWFHGRTQFGAVEFDGDASLVGVEATTSLGFDGARFEREADLSGRLAAPLSLAGVTAGRRLAVRDLDVDYPVTVDLRGTTVPGGRLEQPRDGAVTYDLREATVGDVAIGRPDGPALFDRYRFEQTTFDGFDFSAYGADLSASGWTIHGTGDDDRGSTGRLRPSVLTGAFAGGDGAAAGERAAAYSTVEGTYLRAKNGASTVGDTHAAAEFFILELKHRRRKHFWHALDVGNSPGSLGAAYRWAANLCLGLTAGYGERPSYVVLSSAAAIGGFALAFAALAPKLYDGLPEFLSLSTGAFIALFFGTPGSVSAHPVVSTLAHVEAIVGAFLVAMFVFTLTRSIHR